MKVQEKENQSTFKQAVQSKEDNSGAFQFVDNRPEAGLQRRLLAISGNSSRAQQTAQLNAVMNNHASAQLQLVQKKENRTGLPDNLKSGIESLSGMNMDHVKVHYNSLRPAQLNAHAYAQGSDIHIASGQERHLPHEAWHVVQQAQGRVRPTMQMKEGVPINDDHGLEHEADVMGERALGVGQLAKQEFMDSRKHALQNSEKSSSSLVQRVTEINYTRGAMTYWTSGNNTRNFDVGVRTDALLDPADPKTGSRTAAAPHPSPYTNGHWPTLYQGHLLNANLGGQAIAENLFPVTPAFNGQHSSIVEDHVKAHLLELNDRINDPNPLIAAQYANRRLHYVVAVNNANIAAPFRPADIGNTVFTCTMEYTQNNGAGPGLGTGHDHTLPHDTLDIHVPPPNDTLNERLDNLGWGPDAAPSYQLGVHPGGAAPANVRTVLDGLGNTVPHMFIHV